MTNRQGKLIALACVLLGLVTVAGVAVYGNQGRAPRIAGPTDIVPGPTEVVFTTNKGKLVFQLFPKLAPKHVAQFLRLVSGGVYDGSTVMRIEKDFVVQIDAVYARPVPMTKAQEELLVDIPAEFSDVKHHRRTLSMARMADVDSARASFSIVLGTFPHMDGVYTVFGQMLEESEDTLKKIEASPVVAGTTKPAETITVLHAELRQR